MSPVPWRKSQARHLLEQDLLNDVILINNYEMGPAEVYGQRPEFAEHSYTSFPRRLQALRDQCAIQLNRRQDDITAFENDAQFRARIIQQRDALPLSRWEGSDAERLLKVDITNNLHEQLLPKELHASRNENQQFSLRVFRGHIHQEVKRRKFISSFYGQ